TLTSTTSNACAHGEPSANPPRPRFPTESRAGVPSSRRMLRNPPADPAWRERPCGIGVLLPGAAQVGGQRAGEQGLGAGGRDDLGPAVCLLGRPDLRGGEAEDAFREFEGAFDVEPGEVGAPDLVEGQRAGADV